MDLAGGFPPSPSCITRSTSISSLPMFRGSVSFRFVLVVFLFSRFAASFLFSLFPSSFSFFFARKFTGTKRANGSISYFGSQLEFGFCQTVQRGRGGEETRTVRGSFTAFSFCDASVSRFGKF